MSSPPSLSSRWWRCVSVEPQKYIQEITSKVECNALSTNSFIEFFSRPPRFRKYNNTVQNGRHQPDLTDFTPIDQYFRHPNRRKRRRRRRIKIPKLPFPLNILAMEAIKGRRNYQTRQKDVPLLRTILQLTNLQDLISYNQNPFNKIRLNF